MGYLTRTHDWSQTSLGAPETWPQSLRTTLSIILNSKFPMFLFWGQELLCFYNDAYRPSLGNEGKHPYALGRPAPEVWPEIWEVIHPLIDQVLAGGEATWSEDQLIPIYRNGQVQDVYWTFSYSPVKDESGKTAGVFVTCLETTDKVQNLRKLVDSKDLLHFAIEATQLGTWDYNPRTNTFTSNERLKEWFGLAPNEEIELSAALAAISEKDRQRTSEAIATALDYASGGLYEIEYTLMHPTLEKERIVQVQGRAWFGEDQTAYRFNGTVQDITVQVLARRRLEAEKQRFRTLLEAMPNLAWTTDAFGEPTFANSQWYEYTGLTQQQIMDQGWEKSVHPRDFALGLIAKQAALTTGGIFEGEYRLQRADGQYRWHLARALPVRDILGKITSWVGTLTDIHEQKEIEAGLEQKVLLRTRQMEESVQELKRSNENLQQFAYVASHDLQEPLRKIQSFGDLLKSQHSSELGAGSDYVQRMQIAARRMSVLIDDLLIYSRISTRQQANSEVELNQLIDDVLSNLEFSVEEARATIILEPLPTVQGDVTQLRQLFQNLLSNALKFRRSDTPPLITISAALVPETDLPPHILPARKTATYHHIGVTDNGIGFEEKYLTRIFEVFQRLHGRSQYSGTGIGLAICEKVVANHGGAITALSQPGQGATFCVYLPV